MMNFFTKSTLAIAAAALCAVAAEAQTINTQSVNLVDPNSGKVASVGIGTLLANVNITLPQNGGQLVTGPSGGLGFSQATRTNSTGQLESFVIPDGQLYVGNSTGGPSSKSISGTADQVIVTQSSGAITFNLPQAIAVTSKPQFGGMSASAMAPNGGSPAVPQGSVGFYDDDVTNITSLKAKSNASSNVTYTLPGSAPTISGAMMIAGPVSGGESSMSWTSFGTATNGFTSSADFNLTVGGANKVITDGAIQAGGAVTGASASFTGNVAGVNGIFSGPVSGSSANFSGNMTSGSINSGATTLTGALSGTSAGFTGNATVGGTLGVTGVATFSAVPVFSAGLGNLGAVTGTSANFSGNVSGADGTYTGAVTGGSLGTTGNATVGGTLGVTGVATFSAVPVFSAGLGNLGAVTGTSANFSGNVNGADGTFSGAVSGASAAVTGNATVGGTLGVTGVATFSAVPVFSAGLGNLGAVTGTTADFSGNVTVGGTLGVTGAATFSAVPTFTAGLGSISTGSISASAGISATGAINGESLILSNTTNQIQLGTGNVTTISSVAPTGPRTYTIPDAGGDATVAVYLQENVGYDAANIATATTADVVIPTALGLNPNDIIMVVAPNLEAGLILSQARYSGANQITVRVGNITGADIDPVDQNYTITVIRNVFVGP